MIHPDKIAQLHNPGFQWVERGKFIQRLMHRQHGFIGVLDGEGDLLDVHALPLAATFFAALAAGAINQDAAHGFGRRAEEVSSAIPLCVWVAGQAQPRLMNERSGLQGLSRRFVGHLVCGQLP